MPSSRISAKKSSSRRLFIPANTPIHLIKNIGREWQCRIRVDERAQPAGPAVFLIVAVERQDEPVAPAQFKDQPQHGKLWQRRVDRKKKSQADKPAWPFWLKLSAGGQLDGYFE
jgi:hypothetical protein